MEERLADDPDAVCVVIHALNEWMHEHWSFNYENALFATPIISLGQARLGSRGTRVHRASAAPAYSSSGWRRCRPGRVGGRSPCRSSTPSGRGSTSSDLLVGMHAGDPGYTKYINEWEGVNREANFGSIGNPAFISLMSEKDALDRRAGVDHRPRAGHPIPGPQVPPVEYESSWIRPSWPS